MMAINRSIILIRFSVSVVALHLSGLASGYSTGVTGNQSGLCIESKEKPCLQIPGLGNSEICGNNSLQIMERIESAVADESYTERMTMDLRPFVYNYHNQTYLGLNLTFSNMQSNELCFCFTIVNVPTPLICREVRLDPSIDLKTSVFFWDCAIQQNVSHFKVDYASSGSGRMRATFKNPSVEKIDLNMEAFWLLRDETNEEHFVLDVYPLPIRGMTKYKVQLVRATSDGVNQNVLKDLLISHNSSCNNSACYMKERPIRVNITKPTDPGKYVITVTPLNDICSSSCYTSYSTIQVIKDGVRVPYKTIAVGISVSLFIIILLIVVAYKVIPTYIKTNKDASILFLYENTHPEICDFMKKLAELLQNKYSFKCLVPDWMTMSQGTSQYIADKMRDAERIIFCGPGTKVIPSNTTVEKVSNTYRRGIHSLKGNDVEDIQNKSIQIMFSFSSSSDRNRLILNKVCLLKEFHVLIELLERSRSSKLQAFLISRYHQLSKEDKQQLQTALRKVEDAKPWEHLPNAQEYNIMERNACEDGQPDAQKYKNSETSTLKSCPSSNDTCSNFDYDLPPLGELNLSGPP